MDVAFESGIWDVFLAVLRGLPMVQTCVLTQAVTFHVQYKWLTASGVEVHRQYTEAVYNQCKHIIIQTAELS